MSSHEARPESGKPSKKVVGKDEVYWRILNAAILLDIRWGHMKWSITQLASSAKVTRSLIYYYFGRDKFEILVNAVKLLGLKFSGATEERHRFWQEGRFAESFNKTREMIAQTPALVPFYELNRDKDNEIGSLIRSHEQSFKRKIKQYFPHLDSNGVDSAFALIVGIVFTNQLSDEGVVTATEILLKGIGHAK
ncbi:MAG TPA: TetR/AcrR family transcriptional regulator [Bdellovibrionales bacterium]|nr:TetR/AcrR family transcriptional regulator [Bdellovibrionales bacterium]